MKLDQPSPVYFLTNFILLENKHPQTFKNVGILADNLVIGEYPCLLYKYCVDSENTGLWWRGSVLPQGITTKRSHQDQKLSGPTFISQGRKPSNVEKKFAFTNVALVIFYEFGECLGQHLPTVDP